MKMPFARTPFLRIARRLVLGGALAGLLVSSATPARCGWDDFDYGQKLIDRGYLDYAKRVFETILNDPKSSQGEKDRARFGMALLGKADLNAAQGLSTTPYATVKQKLDGAAGSISDFFSKNPNDAKANDARFALGDLFLSFTQWAAELADDPETLVARGAKAEGVRSDASDSVGRASEIFADLMKSAKTDNDKQLAEFRFVMCQYFKGLTFKHCSTEAIGAFQSAKKLLEDYAFANEQYLTGTYALDFLGKSAWELADCEGDEVVRLRGYGSALENFVAAANAGDQGDEHRKLMCTGFLHIAQLGNHLAERRDDAKYRPLLKGANEQLAKMVRENSWVKKYRAGLLGMIEWAQLQGKVFDAGDEAIKTLGQVSDAATQSGFDDVKRKADSALRALVGTTPYGSSGGKAIDINIVIKVADDLYASAKFAEAVSAYQKVVASAPKDKEGLVKYYLYGWARIGACYVQQKLPVEASAAYDVIADEVRAGRVVLTSSEDALGKIVTDAFGRERAALKDVADRTGDPVAKKRLDAFTDFVIKVTSGLGGAGGQSNLAYGRGLETFKNGLRKRDETPNSDEWKKLIRDSLQYFEQTGVDFKNEYQDVAWVYVVRVPYELGEFAAVPAAADKAFAFWETPEAKKRLATDDKIATNRKAQVAAVTYWKAAALSGAKNDADSLKILEGFKEQFGRGAGDYLGRAMGLRVEILLGQGRIADAEALIDELIREFPDYYKLPSILAQQAEYYRGKEAEVQKKIDAVNAELVGTENDRAKGVTQRLASAIREETSLIAVISDLNETIDRQNKVIASDKPTEEEKRRAEVTKKETEAKLRDAKARLEAVRKDIAELTKKQAELKTQKTALLKEQVPPLRRTAELYGKLDKVLKGLDANAGAGDKKRRRAENVAPLAYRYYKLGKLGEADLDDWQRARELYEDWLGFADVKALPDSDPGKRRTFRLLGEIYYRIAGLTKSDDERRLAYENAVKHLENGLARLAANTPILLAHLSGDSAVLAFKDPTTGTAWRIPVRKIAELAEFRDYVKDILSAGKLPKYLRDADDALYQKAVGAFQKKIASQSDAELKPIVDSLKTAGFDPIFFADHADPETTFLFALAHAYQNSGVAAHAARSLNITSVLLNGPQKLETDSADWWEAQTIQFDVNVAIAERALASGGAASPEAKTFADRAQKKLVMTKQMNPRIGGVERHEQTLAEWQAIQARLVTLLTRLGMKSEGVDLAANTPPPADNTPPAPAAPPAPPAEPAGMAVEPAGMEAPPAPPAAPAAMDK